MKNLWILKQKNHNFFLILVFLWTSEKFLLGTFFFDHFDKHFLIAVFFIKKVSKNKTNPLFAPE